jgi:hypothetical protein
MPVITVNKVVDPKRIIGKKQRAEEEEWHKGSLTPKKYPSKIHLTPPDSPQGFAAPRR